MDVARAVREHICSRDANDQLRLRVLGEQRVVLAHRRDAVEAQALAAFEVDEQQPDLLRQREVSGREVHAVAVVDREGDRASVEDAHEPGLASLVGALRLPLGVDGRDEEHVARLDEHPVVVVDVVADDPLLDPVGESARVETVLQPAAGFVVEGHATIFSGNPQGHQTSGRQDVSSRGPRPFSRGVA